MLKKTIIIPCFNEICTIEKVINRVKNYINQADNIVVVDDCSTDGTTQLLKNIENSNRYSGLKLYFHNENLGKGSAIKTALRSNTINDIIIIQDADLEYNPRDYSKLMLPFDETDADVVYGSRFLGGSNYVRIHFFWHYIANKILTFLCNMFSNLNLTDMETGYKAFRKSALADINLKEKSFGIEPEITLKFAKKKLKFYEVSVSYQGRSYEEGKKIGIKDAFVAIYCIFKYGFFN